MRWIINTVLVQQQGARESTDLQKPVPVTGIARQTRDLQPHDDPGPVHADFSDQPLKALALDSSAARLSLVTVNHLDLFQPPPQSQRAIPQSILTLTALHIFPNLPERGLPYIEEGNPA